MSELLTKTQLSAGGVAFRKSNEQVEVVLISVGENRRWQLPKGTVGRDESNESAALREVREEAGIEGELLDLIDKIEYWFYAHDREQRVRIHKYVIFYLMRYLNGDPGQHDQEVNEARWVEIDQAIEWLSFESEKRILQMARKMIQSQIA